jgi:hypothetical protein
MLHASNMAEIVEMRRKPGVGYLGQILLQLRRAA